LVVVGALGSLVFNMLMLRDSQRAIAEGRASLARMKAMQKQAEDEIRFLKGKLRKLKRPTDGER
jgi:hypothetical protein